MGLFEASMRRFRFQFYFFFYDHWYRGNLAGALGVIHASCVHFDSKRRLLRYVALIASHCVGDLSLMIGFELVN